MNFKYLLVILFSLSQLILKSQNNIDKPLKISGIYPHLKMYNLTSREAGVGAVVPWAGKLWAITYTASDPFNGEDKLYEIDNDLNYKIRPESIGGTHANRMIHTESEQLIIGPYFIDKSGNIRSIAADKMPGRLTGVARHPEDPANKVYIFAMEEGLYEVNVHSLEVKTLFKDGSAMREETGTIDRPHLFGSHGKGAYSSQGKLVISNNGILDFAEEPNGTGVLAEWDGKSWKEIDRKQYVEVTGPGGIYGNKKTTDPIWATGWDHRSSVLRLLDNNKWTEYRFPKSSFTYDGINGFNTEWPRIREIGKEGYLMTMHGMFWKFPGTFSAKNTKGIEPISSYLKIVADYTWWNNHIVLGTDDASTFGNPFVEKATHSNLWFLTPEEIKHLGPKSGFGGVWINEDVNKGTTSSPFLLAGFDKKVLHIAHKTNQKTKFTIEIDRNGNNQWKTYKVISVDPSGYAFHIFPDEFQTTWTRITTDSDVENVTAYFILADKNHSIKNTEIFNSLPGHQTDPKQISHGWIRPGTTDELNLQFVARKTNPDGSMEDIGYYEVDGNMQIKPVKNDSILNLISQKLAIKHPDFSVDNASVLIIDKEGNRFRLPKGSLAQNHPHLTPIMRGIREVVTERSLLNSYGTFYELPRDYSGGIAKIKPITTHNKVISDFCSWRGLMVISGNLKSAREDGHYFASTDKKTGLWFGAIDDLWNLGKPIGFGGPWKESFVSANIPSDPYLMLGYETKDLTLTHDNKSTVEITIEVDIAATGNWSTYKKIEVAPGENVKYKFPDGYTAHWIRFKSNKDCKATAYLEYK